ncbi:MAG: hypothetical protein IKQ20_00045, partial [Bacteroidales bacterium]|nr:hypothetical protein [Bacteroidales bacterium]
KNGGGKDYFDTVPILIQRGHRMPRGFENIWRFPKVPRVPDISEPVAGPSVATDSERWGYGGDTVGLWDTLGTGEGVRWPVGIRGGLLQELQLRKKNTHQMVSVGKLLLE